VDTLLNCHKETAILGAKPDPRRAQLLQQCQDWEQAIRDAQKALDTARRGKGRADRLLYEYDEQRRDRIA
jgi:hypothetical protein